MPDRDTRTSDQILAEFRLKLLEWETNIQDHHSSYLDARDSISAMGSRAQLDLLAEIFGVIGR